MMIHDELTEYYNMNVFSVLMFLFFSFIDVEEKRKIHSCESQMRKVKTRKRLLNKYTFRSVVFHFGILIPEAQRTIDRSFFVRSFGSIFPIKLKAFTCLFYLFINMTTYV